MNYWQQELALVEAAALRIRGLEEAAGRRFDIAAAQAQQAADAKAPALELGHWLAARRDTDAAWGRWAEVMNARPPAERS